MKHRILTNSDLEKYLDDIIECYKDNPQILDSQNPYCLSNRDGARLFVGSFINAEDSLVMGVFDNKEDNLYGVVIFDRIRMADKRSAEVHIASSRQVWGRIIFDIYKDILNTCIFDVLYCQIPQNCVLAIGLVKRLGFKKTGYIPKAIPYVNIKGIERLYDLQIYSIEKKNK